MDVKQEILEIPRAVRETLEKGRAEYEGLVRQTRWGLVCPARRDQRSGFQG